MMQYISDINNQVSKKKPIKIWLKKVPPRCPNKKLEGIKLQSCTHQCGVMLIFFTNWGRLNPHFGGGQH